MGRTCVVCGQAVESCPAQMSPKRWPGSKPVAHQECKRLQAQRDKWDVPEAMTLGEAKRMHRQASRYAASRIERTPANTRPGA